MILLAGSFPRTHLAGQLYLVDWDKDTPLNPITVPYQYAQLNIWKNTEVADLQPGETYTSQSDYLGYEWDVNATSNELANNGYSPPGLVALSSTTVTTNALNNGYIVTGLITGTATHNLTMYRAPSGALVFGAGSVMWSWSLSSLHTPGPDGSPTDAPADPVFQQAMVNLLAQEGIQPATLDSSLVLATQSSDFLPPTSVISTNTGRRVRRGAAGNNYRHGNRPGWWRRCGRRSIDRRWQQLAFSQFSTCCRECELDLLVDSVRDRFLYYFGPLR